MNLIKYTIESILKFKKKRRERRLKLLEEIQRLVTESNKAINDFEVITESNCYINYQVKQEWKDKYSNLSENKIKTKKLTEEEKSQIRKFRDLYISFDKRCSEFNKEFVENEKIVYKDLFDNIEGRILDDQQRECLIKDEINNLVIAGAGSGKTTTIVGKVRYLLERYKYNPDEILILSFTNASASEMSKRIKRETNKNIDVMTFHKLGLEIISKVEEQKPSLTELNMREFVKEKFNYLTKQSEYNNILNKYFLSYMKPYKGKFEFKVKGDYIDYLRDANIRTFKNEIVKSFEEMEIANFLHMNKIKYRYEEKYKYKTANRQYSQYKPDFYLPDYNIYIEHFGIDKNGNVPSFFQGKDEKSAKEIYNEGIKWKRRTHKENNTLLIETYSWEKDEGVLTDRLKKKLEKVGVKFEPMSRNEFWKLIENDKTYELTSFINLMTTFINLFKANVYTVESIKNKNSNNHGNKKFRNEIFIDLVAPMFEAYERELKNKNEIDFSDMINRASRYVRQGKFDKKYSYIIVDEYQDISIPRFNLIKAIKDKNNSKLFCVGDDFQSIYRFAGSNISLFVDFEKYFGVTEKSFIETTYRFNKNLIDLSSNFILKNKSQIRKQLKPFNNDEKKSFELVYGENHVELDSLLKKKLMELPKNAVVVLLGRYKNDLGLYLDRKLTFRYDRHTKRGIVTFKNRKDLNIEFLTIHKSKGLQADYVFILNNSSGKYGFPSQVEDDPILELLMDSEETFEFAEERRLFYVALTRSKKNVYLMINKKFKSPFIREIEEEYNIREVSSEETRLCPVCKKGKLIYKQGIVYQGRKLPDFYGCSNFPYCNYKRKIR